MANFGKWIGGGLGWVFGGPIGAIVGFALGSFYDNSSDNPNVDIDSFSGDRDFKISLLVLSAAVMKADGKQLKSELEYIKGFLIKNFGQHETLQQLQILKEILNQDINHFEVTGQIRQHLDYSSRLQLLHYLFGVAASDSEYHSTENKILNEIASGLGIENKDFESISAMFNPSPNSAYKILEISPEASDEEVKKAYRAMAVKYHPDKVSHLGEDVVKAAKEKFVELQNAYEKIKKQRGMV